MALLIQCLREVRTRLGEWDEDSVWPESGPEARRIDPAGLGGDYAAPAGAVIAAPAARPAPPAHRSPASSRRFR